jgi:hypothetical protein
VSKLEIGTILAGRYRIDRLRGSGGLGAVYEATDLGNNSERVAIKVLLDLEATPKEQTRFLQEAELASQVKHPNVVAPKAFVPPKSGEHPAFIVMELIADGVPLHRYIDSAAPLALSTEEAIDLTKQILSALAAAHRLGVIHRDVKPANILLRFDDKTKKRTALLLDFGIATMLGDRARVRTTTGVMLGTPGWAAPEQVRAEGPIDARADVYAVGGCLYNMLTGKRAFTANDMVRQLAGHPPPRVPSTVPEWLGDVVAKALEADPKKRFESAAEMLTAMEHRSSPPGRFARTLIVTMGIGAIGIGVVLLASRRPTIAVVVVDATPKNEEEASIDATTIVVDSAEAPQHDDPAPPPPSHAIAGPPPRCVCNGAMISFCDHPMPSQCSCVRENNALCMRVDPANRDKCAVGLTLGTAGAKCTGFRRSRNRTYETETVEGAFDGCSRCYSPVESRRKYRGKIGDSCTGYDEDGAKQTGKLSCLREEESR